MKKIDKTFVWIILIEIMGVITFSTIIINYCGSACDSHSLLNPFGFEMDSTPKMCIAMCVKTPFPIFYWISDLLMLTLIIYSIYLLNKKITR